MCGVSAVFSQESCNVRVIRDLNHPIRHRGPDDEGFYVSNNVKSINAFGGDTPDDVIEALSLTDMSKLEGDTFTAMLGHRRLSIVDTSWRGHQPMMSECSSYSISYNGEIYNASAIRRQLQDLGHEFRSHSDTEVVLAAYKQWGAECLSMLNGMFAFIIFDNENNNAFVARDRFGVKPLYYYYLDPTTIAFASEIKQFSKLDCWKAELNIRRAIDYLNWGQTDHTNETLFKEVYQVPAGHFIEFNVSAIPVLPVFVSWYSLVEKRTSLTYEEAVKEFKSLFTSSVDYRTKADVPIGTCLSGGLDSSSIVCTMNEIIEEKQPQVTFSSCSSDKKYDETQFVDSVLEHCRNIEAHKIEVNHEDFWDELSTLIYQHDEPFLSPSVYAEWCIFRQVSKTNVKVTLDGHGADEILVGYYTFFGPYLSGLLRRLRFYEYIKGVISIRNLHGYSIARLVAMSIKSFLPHPVQQYFLKLFNRPSSYPDWINASAVNEPIQDIGMRDKTVEAVSLDQLLRFSVPKQLKWCDRDSMAHSVESRVPFLDYRLVEFIYSLPVEYKIHRGLTKRILRDALAGVIPDDVKNRMNKMGFVTPGERWVLENPEFYRLKLKEAIEFSGGILDDHFCYKYFASMTDGSVSFNNSFWRILFFGEWIKCYKVVV